ncbi:MAG: ABC transporter permease [Acidimicrobiia bacterium]
MQRLFGLPVGDFALVLTILVGTGIAVVATLALRNLVFFRLGVRNARRRVGRSALIVVGLMLATAIIAAALGTGDTMGRAVRSSVLRTLGNSDEWVTVKGAKPDLVGAAGGSTGVEPFDQRIVGRVEQTLRATTLTDGVTPAIIRPVAAQDLTSRQTEPRVTIFAPDPERMAGFGTITGADGRSVRLASLPSGSVLLNTTAADALGAKRGHTIGVLGASGPVLLRVADVVSYRGAGTPKSAMLMPLPAAQELLGTPGRVDEILISNRGGETAGVGLSHAVVARLRPVLSPAGLEAQDLKRTGLDQADQAGNAFMQMFSTFGSFSIAAGILLIFLIFVMLAAERRTEMGVARAIGTQRGHLVEVFLFEGAAYDLIAAALGALLGIAVSFAMVAGISRAFATTSDLQVRYSVRWSSVAIAYGLGVLITLLVVAFSAWRVSVLNIVTAVRNLPDPPRRRRRGRGLIGAGLLLALGALLVVSGRSSSQAMPFLLGASLLAVGSVPLLRVMRVPDRISYTCAGLAIVIIWLLPFRVVEVLVPGAQMDFSLWVVGGLLIVLGATWTVIYNADALLGGVTTLLGRVHSLSAVLRISVAYPLRTRLRTGMTLAMFTLVVFTLVVGITTPNSFIQSSNKPATFGGGYDVRAMTSPASPVQDMGAAVRSAKGIDPASVTSVGSISFAAVKARQSGGAFVDYPLRGLDASFLAHNRYALGSRARGYTSDRQVWSALARGGNVVVVDPWIVPHRRNWSFGALTQLHLHGLFAEDRTFTPVTIQVRNPATGAVVHFTVIGVLRDSMPLEMAGISTSQRALAAFGSNAPPTMHLFDVTPRTNATVFTRHLESAFLANGLQADTFAKLVHDNIAGSMLFLRLIEGFMGLGLIVGVAALGVIAARSVVERRQQIGVLRAIGFQKSTVRLGFLIESGFIALTSIVVGSVLGLAMSYNVINDAQHQATWPNVQLTIPWLNLIEIFVVVLAVALATTYLPARRASQIYAAEALRYE